MIDTSPETTTSTFILKPSNLTPGVILTSGLLCQSDIVELFEHEAIDQAAITAVFEEQEANKVSQTEEDLNEDNFDDKIDDGIDDGTGNSTLFAKNEITTISSYLKTFENACTEIEKFENTRHLISKRKYESIACNSLLHNLKIECQRFLGEDAIILLELPVSDRARGRYLKQALSYFSAISDHISAVLTEFVVLNLIGTDLSPDISSGTDNSVGLDNFAELEIENILEISSENKLKNTLDKFLRLQFDDEINEKHETSKFTLSEHLVSLLRDCLDRSMVFQAREKLNSSVNAPHSNEKPENHELLELRAAIGTSLSLLQDIISTKTPRTNIPEEEAGPPEPVKFDQTNALPTKECQDTRNHESQVNNFAARDQILCLDGDEEIGYRIIGDGQTTVTVPNLTKPTESQLKLDSDFLNYESFYEPFGMRLPGKGITSNGLILDELKSILPDKISKNRRLARKKQLYPNMNKEQLEEATFDMEKYIEETKDRTKKSGDYEIKPAEEIEDDEPENRPSLFKMDLSQFAKAVAERAVQSEQILE